MVDNAPSAGEVRAFAQQLLAWADRLVTAHRSCRVLADADRHEFVLTLAEAARERARAAARAFPDAGFVSPAWRILLEIFIREAGGYRVSLDELTEWDELPLLTVLGNLNRLIEKQLVERRDAGGDPPAVWLLLTPAGRQKLTDLLLQFAEPEPEQEQEPRAVAAAASIERR